MKTHYLSRTQASEARWVQEQADIRSREESTRKAYLEEIERRGSLLRAGKNMGHKHKLAALRVSYEKAKAALYRLETALNGGAS